MSVTMDQIEEGARCFAGDHARLVDKVMALEDAVAELKRRHLGGIRRAVERAAASEEALRSLVQAAPELFVKPRTLVLHGVKVGWVKGKGALDITDAERTVQLIRKHLPELADTLIRVVEQPHKPALLTLSVADLKRIGCTVIDAGDAVVVKPVDSDISKLVDALLKAAVDTTTEEGA